MRADGRNCAAVKPEPLEYYSLLGEFYFHSIFHYLIVINTTYDFSKYDYPNDTWTKIIRPKRGLLDLRLREFWRARELIMLFVWRDFVSIYKQTILGPLWYFIQPVLTTIVFTVIFGNIAQLSTDGLPPFLFYMAGNTIWRYFHSCVMNTPTHLQQMQVFLVKCIFPA